MDAQGLEELQRFGRVILQGGAEGYPKVVGCGELEVLHKDP